MYSTIYEFNEASIKSAIKAGFKKSGAFRESVYYNMKYYDEIIFEMTKQNYIDKEKNENERKC